MATPSISRNPMMSNYVSSAILKPETGEAFVKRYGAQNLTGLLELIGGKSAVSQKTYNHFEEDFIHQGVTISGVTDVTAAGHKGVIIETTSFNANGTSPIRLGDIVELESGYTGLVVAIKVPTAATVSSVLAGYTQPAAQATALANSTTANAAFQLVSLDDASNATLGAAAAQYAAIIGNTWGEATDQPEGIVPEPIEYANNTMIIKESFEVSGSEATNVSWFNVDGVDGKSGNLWYLKGESDTYKRFMNYREMMMLKGNKINAAVTGIDSSIGVTEGLFNFMGNTTALGGSQITAANLDNIIKKLDANRGAKENAFYHGLQLGLDSDDLLSSYNGYYTSGATGVGANFGTFGNSKDMALDLGFKSWTRGGYTFHKNLYDPFTYQGTVGAQGGTMNDKYSGTGFIIPLDKQRDAKTRESVPSIAIRYKEAGGYSRDTEHWLTGSAILGTPTSENDSLKCHYRSECGFEGFGANRFMMITA